MRELIRYLFFLSSLCLLITCGETSTEHEEDKGIYINDKPCGFDINSFQPGDTITFNCLLDLNGKKVYLPKNIYFDFNGGDLRNGTIVFNGGYIDGRLLNSTLEIEGNVALKSTTFQFNPKRWDIVEGGVDSETALKNTSNLEKTMFLSQKLGAIKFEIDKIDAYFEVTKVTSTTSNQNWYPSLEAVNIPSNFHLSMSDNSHLRIFPANDYNRKSGAILAVRDAENIKVTGGNLYGDRDQRVYSANDNGLEGSHLFIIHSGKNVTLDGIKFQEGSAGTIAIYSFGFSFNPDYKPTDGVTIKNCTIKDSRRMAMAITDARNVLIDGNTIINTGQPSANTDGGEVGYAINIEPERYRDENGNLIEWQKVFNVVIKRNTEYGSRGGFLTLTIGQDIIVEENNIGSRLVWSFVSGVRVKNNRFRAVGKAADSWAIFAAGSGETVFNNEIDNNSIEGYSLAMVIGSKDAVVKNNVINDCNAGIQLSKALNADIHNNTIIVKGNPVQATNTSGNNINIHRNSITSTGNFNLYFAQMNNKDEDKNNSVIFDNNTFLSTKAIVFSNTNGVTFKNNTVNGGLQLSNNFNVNIIDNAVKPNESDGIRLYNSHTSVKVMNNIISKPTGADRFVCINNNSTNPAGLTIEGNVCN